MVRNISKSGISPDKVRSNKTGPYTIIGRAVNNNAYILQHDQTGVRATIGLRRIRLISRTD